MLVKISRNFFNPRSIAVVGAARERSKVGNIIVRSILNGGFKGKLYPVNPNAMHIEHLVCYRSYTQLPVVPDLAIVALPAAIVLEAVEEIARKGTSNIVILSAGFKESGADGKKRETELVAIAEKYHLSIIGPNCLGFVNNIAHLNASFGESSTRLGNVRFISQSGAIATAMFSWADQSAVDFSNFITLGNKAVLSETEILGYWSHGLPASAWPSRLKLERAGYSSYRPVGLYLESIEQGESFLESVEAITEHDPVFILKPGKAVETQRAMQSHTGAMANDDAVLNAALASVGAVRCDGTEDLFDLTRVFAWENAPDGPHVAVVSNAGGPAVITTDSIKEAGLELAVMSAKTHAKLEAALPRAAALMNPIDVLGDALADRYAVALDAVLAEPDVDAIIVILTPQVMTQIKATAEVIARFSQKYDIPILCSFMGGHMIERGEAVLNRYKIPSFKYPERAVRALAAMWHWRSWQKNHTANRASAQTTWNKLAAQLVNNNQLKQILDFIHSSRDGGRTALSSFESNHVIALAGVLLPPTTLFSTTQAARDFLHEHQPVVLKLSSPDLVHKTEAGGVITAVATIAELEQGLRRLAMMPAVRHADIELQKQITNGVEVLVGIKRDASFGNVLMLGAGGINTELLADAQMVPFPLSQEKIMAALARTKVFRILQGYRTKKTYALNSLVRLVLQLGALAQQVPLIRELEVNPVIVTPEAAWAVDARIILQDEAPIDSILK